MLNTRGQGLRIVAFFTAMLIHIALFLFFGGPGQGIFDHFFPEDSEELVEEEDQKKPLNMVFVEIQNPDQSQPKEETPFYSNQNSQAQTENPTEEKSNLAPQEGEQEDLLRFENVTLQESVASQFSPPETQKEESKVSDQSSPGEAEETEVDQSEDAQSPPLTVKSPDLPESRESVETLSVKDESSELPPIESVKVFKDTQSESEDWRNSILKPNQVTKNQTASSQPRKRRPKNLREARTNKKLVGEKTRILEQSPNNQGVTGMVDASNKSFGDYDLKVQVAIQNLWYKYISGLIAGSVDRGMVRIKFRLHESGSIEQTKVMESAVGSLFTASCQDAIENAAPFGKWTKKMRDEIGKPYRDIIFTFYYR